MFWLCVFAARKKENIFEFRLKVKNLYTFDVLEEAPGLYGARAVLQK